MKSALHGKRTSDVEVTNVSGHGFWLLLDDQELFLSFDLFPWFRHASIGELVSVQRPSLHHLYWPKLDVDIAVESITHPQRYPLVSKVWPTRLFPPKKARTKAGRRRPVSAKPKAPEDITSWKTFVEAGRRFFDANQGCPMFQLIETLDELYRLAYLKAPFPTTCREEDDFFHMCFMICHRALLAAATSAGSGRPEDAHAITRRALEAAKTALAMKADPENFKVWRAIDVRTDRWTARAQGGKPKGPVNLQYEGLSALPLYQDLQAVIGTLSDFSVHFTPEHVGQYRWEQTSRPDGGTDRSFGVDADAVAKEMLMLADQHRLIIRVFDHCLDGRLLKHSDVKQVAQQALNLYKEMLRREGFTDEATAAGENW